MTEFIKSKMAIEYFPVSEEEGHDIDEIRDIFEDDADFRAALEDYFHIYDDYATMSPQEFDTYFSNYIHSSKSPVSKNVPKKPIKSTRIGQIRDKLAMGEITQKQAEILLQKEGKSYDDSVSIVKKWKSNGQVRSSLDKAVKKCADFFGTVPTGSVVECGNILTLEDEAKVKEIASEENVDVQIGRFSVVFREKPKEIKSSLIDKYIKNLGRLVKETDEGSLNDDRSARLNDKLDDIYDQLVEEKDPDIMYDRESGEYTIKGDNVKRYVIEKLGDNYFGNNNLWDKLFDTILPNIEDFATTKEIAACYKVFEKLSDNHFKFITNTFNKSEADVFEKNGFVIKMNKVIIDSGFTAGNEVVIEIERHGKWEMVSQTDDERGWSLGGTATIFDNKDQAKNSKLVRDLQKAGYSVGNGNMRYTKYD